MIGRGLESSQTEMLACAHPVPERRSKPHPNQLLKCPRCESLETKFCYYNNYSLTQPRYFCKNCKRYWTDGGALRNVPVGGGLRKNKRSKQKTAGQTDGTPKPPSITSDSLTSEKSHVATPTTRSSSDGSPNTSVPDEVSDYRYSNPPVDGKYQFDPSRRVQRMFEIGEQASVSNNLPHFSLGEVRSLPQFLAAGYSYSLALEGLPQYEGGFLGYNLSGPSSFSKSEQGHSCSGDMPEVLGAATPHNTVDPSRSTHGEQNLVLESCAGQPVEGQTTHRHQNDDPAGESFRYIKGKLPAGSELPANNKSFGAAGHETVSDEASSVVHNHYDWQQISEGLFGGPGDFFYMPGGSWPDWSHFDAGHG